MNRTDPTATRPRALFVTTVPGTLRAFLLPFADDLRSLGWGVDAAACDATKVVELRACFDAVFDVPWTRRLASIGNVMAFKVIRDLVEDRRYDVVHVHTPIASAITRAALRGLRRDGRVAVFYTAHGFHFFRGNSPIANFVYRNLERVAARWTDELLVMNDEDLEAACQLAVGGSVTAIPGIGVDASRYGGTGFTEADVLAVREELRVPEGSELMLMVAEFAKRKRHADVIEALAEAPGLRVVMAFAGTGPLLEPMKRRAEHLGVLNRLRFLGVRSDVPRLLHACRAVVLPSSQEGLPRSLLEAMAMGRCTIASDVRGNRDLVRATGGGILFGCGDVAALRDAIADIATDAGKAAALGEAARRGIERYAVERVLDITRRLYTRRVTAASRQTGVGPPSVPGEGLLT